MAKETLIEVTLKKTTKINGAFKKPGEVVKVTEDMKKSFEEKGIICDGKEASETKVVDLSKKVKELESQNEALKAENEALKAEKTNGEETNKDDLLNGKN